MKKSKKLEISENVIQGNDISRAFYKMDVNEQRLATFAMYKLEKLENILEVSAKLCAGIKPKIKLDDYKAHFSVSEMCQIMHLDYNEQTAQNYKKSLLSLPQRIVKINDNKHLKSLPLVIYSDWNKETQEIEIVFNPYFFTSIFDALNYSKANLEIFGQLKYHASQRLYFYLLSFRNMSGKYTNPNGIWQINTTLSELRKMFNLNTNEIARNSDFVQRYIKKSCMEINKYNFEFTVDYEVSGRPISNIKFICCEKMNLKKLPSNENKKMREKAIDINNEKKEMEYLKNRYPEDWKRFLNEELQQVYFDFGSEEINLEIRQHEVVKRIKEKYHL